MPKEIDDLDDCDMDDHGNMGEPLELVLGDMNIKDQLTALEGFQVELIKSLEDLRRSADYRVKLKTTGTISGLIRNISASLQKQRELEMKDDIDFTSAKARRGMMMLVEAFFESMVESQVDDDSIDTVKSILQVKLMGFEEKLTKELKGLSGELLDEVKNPLL